MNEKTEKSESAAKPTRKAAEVLVRLSREEVEQCKAETGAEKSATAVASFVRKSLRGRRG